VGVFVIHYHEIALKKKNRPFFVNKLAENIRVSLGRLEGAEKVKIEKLPGRLLLANYRSSTSIVKERLSKIPGIANFMLAFEVPVDIEKLKERVGEELDPPRADKFESFRITTQRGDKTFPMTSEEVNRELGAFVQQKTGARVDLKNPEFTVFIEILHKQIFFSFEKIQGVGGLPVGSSGKIVSLLSGGIDSPVASFKMFTRGCRIVFVHFHSFPYLDISSQEKASDLVKLLNEYQGGSKLYLIPFGDIQKRVVLAVPEKYRVVIYRRLMVSIAEKIAEMENAGALLTGESLGQVASQTLENMSVVDDMASLLVLRPLVGMGKEEIINIAKKIGSYETSILSDQDCCQLFMPKSPATKSKKKDIERSEADLRKDVNLDEMIESALNNMEVKNF